jgi:hypothetical protein
MYVFCCSYAHNVAANNKWLAFVSTTVETSSPEAELAPGLALLGHIEEKFVEVVDVHEPLADGRRCAAFQEAIGAVCRTVLPRICQPVSRVASLSSCKEAASMAYMCLHAKGVLQ